MENQEQLDILNQGVQEWNQWREKHPDIRPDLREADLRFAILRKADLRGALQLHFLGDTHETLM